MANNVNGVTGPSSEPTPVTYPILAAAAPLPVLREQAERFRRYLADDSNTFDGAWLEEQQHRLDAVQSYVRNRQVRAEVSQCQRWIELRIGEWLGPAKEGFKGNQYRGSSPGEEAKIHDRHKHEFRFMAEHKAIAADIMKNHPGKEITRAGLIAAIGDAVLVERGALAGSERKVRGQYLCPCGESFDRIVWHCEVCAYHWPLEREECGQCHQGMRPEKKPLHDLEGIDPSLFKLATRALGLANNFSKFVASARPEDVWAGLKDYEKPDFFTNCMSIGAWINFIGHLREGEEHVFNERSEQ